MVVDHVSCEHVVVVVGRVGEVSVQVFTPGEGSDLRGVARAALGVSQKVEGQIRQDFWQVGGRNPSP